MSDPSPIPPCSPSPRRPCCSCRPCWPSNGADEVREPAGGRWAVTDRRCWCCTGLSMAPGWQAGCRPPDRPLDGLPVSARGHRRPRRCGPGATRRTAGRPGRRTFACHRGWHPDPYRPLPRAGPDRAGRPPRPAGGPVVVGQARRPRWQRPGPRRARRLAAVDLGCAARPRARHHRASGSPRAAAGRVDRRRRCRAGRPGLRRRTGGLDPPDQEGRRPPAPADQRTVNALHAATRALAERGNSLLKTTFQALRRVSLCPWRIGAITAAALVLLHHQHGRTT
jgi:hypothetical protein